MRSPESGLLSRMREGRRSPAALKVALSNIRSAKPGVTVFVFEGIEDVGVYEVWIARCPVRPIYEPLPGRGKDQLLGLREMLRADTTSMKEGVFFFMDWDFDGLKGASGGTDLNVLDAYSIENHLASEEVLESLLNDELRCAGRPLVRSAVLERYRRVSDQFHLAVRDVNLRLFVARRCNIRVQNLTDSIYQCCSIELDGIKPVFGALTCDLVRLEREPTKDEEVSLIEEFDALEPSMSYRGKYELQMFTKWVTKLAGDRCSAMPSMFAESERVGNVQAALSLRSLATRSVLPEDFVEFIATTVH